VSTADRRARGRRRLRRVGFGVLAVSQGVIGGWALFGPAAFFDRFPGTRAGWVSLLPPYNEHLVRDVGALSLALTVLLAYAAVRADPPTGRIAALAFAAYAVPHTVFHAQHLEGFGPAEAVAQMTGFALQLGLVTLLFMVSLGLDAPEHLSGP
jgi:hypothetical protein